MVKKLKGKSKTKAKPKTKAVSKSGRASSSASQNVTVNVGGKGGGGSKGGRQRAPVRQQQPIQQAQYQGPTGYDFAQLKNDILTNVGSKITEFAGNKAGDVLGLNNSTSNTNTNYDIAGLITAGSIAAKTGYDIYKDYSEGERLQRQHKVANVPIPVALPVNPPNLENVISRPKPVPRRPLLPSAPAREEKEREVKENPSNYLVPGIAIRPERQAIPEHIRTPRPPPRPLPATQPTAQPTAQPTTQPTSQPAAQPAAQPTAQPSPSGLPNQTKSVLPQPAAQPFQRRKTPAELSTEQMLADRDRRNKITREAKEAKEAKEANKPAVPLARVELSNEKMHTDWAERNRKAIEAQIKTQPPQIARRPERRALPTAIEKKPEPQFSVGEEPKEIIRGRPVPSFANDTPINTLNNSWSQSLLGQKSEPALEVKKRMLINKPFNIKETERKVEPQQAQIIKAPVSDIVRVIKPIKKEEFLPIKPIVFNPEEKQPIKRGRGRPVSSKSEKKSKPQNLTKEVNQTYAGAKRGPKKKK